MVNAAANFCAKLCRFTGKGKMKGGHFHSTLFPFVSFSVNLENAGSVKEQCSSNCKELKILKHCQICLDSQTASRELIFVINV